MSCSDCMPKQLVLDWVTVAGVIPDTLCNMLALAASDMVGRVRTQGGLPMGLAAHDVRKTPFVVMELDARQCCDPDILRWVRRLMPCECILIYVSPGACPPHPCWLAVAAQAGFAAGTMARVALGAGLVHLACQDPAEADRLMRRSYLAAPPGGVVRTTGPAELAR